MDLTGDPRFLIPRLIRKTVMESELSWVIDALPGFVWTARPDGCCDFISRHWSEFTGLGVEHAMGRGWETAIHPDDRPRLVAQLGAILAAGQPADLEGRLRRFDGKFRRFSFRIAPVKDRAGRLIKWCGINIDIEDLRDITERKKTEDELRRHEAQLAHGQALSQTGSFSWKLDTDEITFSDELYRIFGFGQGTPVTLELIASRVDPDDRAYLAAKVHGARQAGQASNYEIRLKMPDGRVKHVQTVSQTMRDPEGQLEVMGAVRDVTERKQSDETLSKVRTELAHVTRVASLGALTASIAHEINQPLSGILTNASTCLRMLAADPPNVDGARSTAQRTIRDGNRASEVIERLRALFARKKPEADWFDFNDSAREVLALSASDLQCRRITLQTDFASDLPAVKGDRVQLQQVTLNLVLNAADAMTSIVDRPRDLLVGTGADPDGGVRLWIRDAGVGIDPQDAERLFDAFYTTKANGMGIGLAISRSVIESHNGRLWATPNDGPGTTFSFWLPDEPRPMSARPAPSSLTAFAVGDT
ncbi:MAG TPA: PAS domain-containing protein [Rhizomicrobium sp.]